MNSHRRTSNIDKLKPEKRKQKKKILHHNSQQTHIHSTTHYPESAESKDSAKQKTQIKYKNPPESAQFINKD